MKKYYLQLYKPFTMEDFGPFTKNQIDELLKGRLKNKSYMLFTKDENGWKSIIKERWMKKDVE